MKIKCDKNILMNNIVLAQKAVANKSPVSVLECILLICDDDGFRLMATDLEIAIKTANLECEVIEKGSVALPSKFFSDIIRNLPEGQVSIEVKSGLITIIKCKLSEFKIVGRNPDEFPELPSISLENGFKMQQFALKKLIKHTIFSICEDESKPNLMGALLEVTGKTANMVTCDSFRVSYMALEADTSSNISIIIPAKAINELYKILSETDDEFSTYITDKHILFDNSRCILISRLIEGEFINYANIFPDEFETTFKVNKLEIENALERAVIVSFQENKKNPVLFDITDNGLIITTGAETGNSYDELDIDFSGKDLKISFNPKFLLDAINAINEDNIILKFNSQLSPCVIKPEFDDNYKYLILPLRIRS